MKDDLSRREIGIAIAMLAIAWSAVGVSLAAAQPTPTAVEVCTNTPGQFTFVLPDGSTLTASTWIYYPDQKRVVLQQGPRVFCDAFEGPTP